MLVRGALLGSFAVLAALAVGACGSSKRAGNGGECFVASDCTEPLVCVPQKDGTRKCTDDLTNVVGEIPPEAGPPAPDTGAPEAGANEAGPEDPPDSGAVSGDQ